MSIASIPSSSAQIATLQTSAAQRGGRDCDGDGDGDHGGTAAADVDRLQTGLASGRMGRTVLDALASLGLSVPDTSAQPEADGAASAPSSAAGSSAQSLGAHLHQFMHAMFDAVRSEALATAQDGAASGPAKDAGSIFRAGMSALVADVAQGEVSSQLQAAFNALVADLQPSRSSSGQSATPDPTISLKNVLVQLQQAFLYGDSGAPQPGMLVSATA